MKYLFIIVVLLFWQSALANHHEEKIIIERVIGSESEKLKVREMEKNLLTKE